VKIPQLRSPTEAVVSSKLRVMIVDERDERARILESALARAGHEIVARLSGPVDLQESVLEIQPDVVIVDMDCPDRDTLENMSRITREQPRPMVMFVDQSDSGAIRAAVQAGVSAYVVGGLDPDRVRPILEVAIARFEELQSLRRELAGARTDLADRKMIERAKGILMKNRNLSEEEAYQALRKAAMNRKRRLADVAREIVGAAELLQ
jgi:response regulator NasT